MATYYVLYNPMSGHGTNQDIQGMLKELLPESENTLIFRDITKTNYTVLFDEMKKNDRLLLVGGDGTLNRFVNETQDFTNRPSVYYYPAGSGNDFWHDICDGQEKKPVCIDEYIADLPQVIVNGKSYYFINGIGYGIDGYCCEVGDKLRESSTKPVDYTAIAIKGLLFHYKTTKAKITVDGEVHEYKKVWLAPTMNGTYYGGGMIPTPGQKRLGEDGTVSAMVYYGVGKLKALMVFPSIFKGEHIKKEKMVEILRGNEITVEFDRPTALQIDGETVLNVTKYTVLSRNALKNAEKKEEIA